MGRPCDGNILEVSVLGNNGEIKQLQFVDKTEHSESHINVNYTAYLEYISQNYPNLHTFDIGIDDETESRREEVQKCLENDYKLLNRLDIEQYDGLNSPDDIWDSIAKSVYHMGYIGRYARIATSLEAGANHIFNFEDFAHVYPFLKSCHGNGYLVRKMQGKGAVENKKFNSYRLNYTELPEHTVGSANAPSIEDVELEKRSSYNQSYVLKPESDNPPGTEWSYLSVDKDQVELGNSYRRGYSYVPPPPATTHDNSEDTNGDKSSAENDPNASTESVEKEKENEQIPIGSLPDNRRYIYEKFLFCSYKWCPGSMRIILDCIHNVVILSVTNTHYDCSESHRRKIYDIVRKLFVVNHGDIDLIDVKYATIPRRYGLAFIESWIHSDEYETARSSEYTPSFLGYSTNEISETKSWASQKNRNWVIDAFYDIESVDTKTGMSIKGKEKKEPTHLKFKQNYVDHPQRLADLTNYGIEYWNFDTHRYDLFGNVVTRSEWEFHIDQDVDGKNREIFRFWRKYYFGLSDFVRQASQGALVSESFGLIKYFLTHGGDYTLKTDKIHIYDFNEEPIGRRPKQTKESFLKDLYFFTGEFIWEEFDHVLFRQYTTLCILPNPDGHIMPYPFNRRVQNVIEGVEIEVPGPQSGCIFVCTSISEIANSDKVVICERDIQYQDIRLAEWKALERRKGNIHASDQIWSMAPDFHQTLGMMTIYDRHFLQNRYIMNRFQSLDPKHLSYSKTIGEALGSEKRSLRTPLVSARNLPVKRVTKEKDLFVGFRILYEVEGSVKVGYVICLREDLDYAIKIMVKKRTKIEKLPLVLLVDDTHCNSDHLKDIEDKVRVIQLRGILFERLKNLLPFDYLLFLMRAILVDQVDMKVGAELLKKRLPPQRRKDTEFYKLDFEKYRIASNAGLVRMAIEELCKVNDFLKFCEDVWRIGKSKKNSRLGKNAKVSVSRKDKEKWKFFPKNFPKFSSVHLAKILSKAGKNGENIALAKDAEAVRLFEWAIDTVNVAEKEHDCAELVSGEFRDIIELIKRTTDFV